jgi:hypothetical protein
MFNTHASKALHTLRVFALSILGLFVGLFNVIATYLKGKKIALERLISYCTYLEGIYSF